jgi:hypothetical protein
MKARACVVAGIAGAALALGGLARAASQETPDDLTVVKRAVAQAPAPVPAAPVMKAPAPAARGSKPQWFKVRVIDKGSKKGRVTVNLPLALVRAFDDVPVDWKCGGEDYPARRCSIKVADVLEALEAGQELVEVDDEEHVVKIWVE